MNSKELELRRDVETIGKANLKFDWDMDTVLTAFTEFEDPKNGLEKTMEYWEEFLKSEMYEEYWKGYRNNGKYHNWGFHLSDVKCMLKCILGIRGIMKEETEKILWGIIIHVILIVGISICVWMEMK